MQIREAKIFSFGKLQNREYVFAPGINVIYGANETGKSTLHAFLVGMLFGMEKPRGRAGKEDYSRYEPWHAPAYYSGALRFSVGERPFYLERNFYHREKRELLRNEADGEELSVAYGDLTVLMGGIGKEIYGNTYDIAQSGAVTGKELAEMLAEYLANAAEGGDGEVHVARALELLQRKKKELNAEWKSLQEKKAQEKNVLRTEQAVLEEDISRLSGQMEEERCAWKKVQKADAGAGEAGMENVQTKTVQGDMGSASTEKTAEQEEAGRHGGWGFCVLAAVAVINAVCLLLQLPFGGGNAKMEMVWLLTSAGALGLAAAGFLAAAVRSRSGRRKKPGTDEKERRRDGAVLQAEMERKRVETATEQQRAETACQQEMERKRAEAARQQAERLLARLGEVLEDKETRLYNIRERLEELEKPALRERELASELDALALAAEEITRLAKEHGEEMSDILNSEVSRYVSAITDGRYDSVCVDENGGLLVQTEGKEVPPDALSRGTLEQFYLALRLAVGNIVMKEEPMPVLLDETFSMYDDVRLGRTLRMLAGLPNQILIFSCQKREMELLEQLKISYHRVDLE